MDGPLLSAGKHARRRPARAVSPLQLIVKYPVTAAVLYIIIGGVGAYLFWASNSRQQIQQQQAADLHGKHVATAQHGDAAKGTAASGPNATNSSSTVLAERELILCTDACHKAKDGVCDDGRTNLSQALPTVVLCDLGSDCSDCGPWKGVRNSSSWSEPVGPVEYLRRNNIPLATQQSPWEPKFHFANTPVSSHKSASKGTNRGASHSISNPGGFEESAITHITYQVLRDLCRQGKEGVMVDVGAGAGWYSILAGRLGCRVIAMEPLTTSRAIMEYNTARNKLQDKIQLRASVAAQYPSAAGYRNYTVVEPRSSGLSTKLHVAGETLDQVVLRELQLRNVALLRVNAGGAQALAMAGAQELLEKQLVNNIVLQYRSAEGSKAHCDQDPKLLLSLLEAGYNIGHIANIEFGDKLVKSLSEPLQTLPAVTESNLKFDLFDCKQMTQERTERLEAACSEMRDMQLIGHTIPERLHPKSFRSSFEGTAYVWASRDTEFKAYLQGPSVGVFPPERKITDSWFVPEWSDVVMGGKSCRGLQRQAEQQNMTAADRAALLVRHR
eukprot:GHUV01016868.1.p1 GENE.GHUV01016868.1~~GHUV01016868.1.p1  ORF type:complete len:556 (+),score=129.98 GHUV01016868.1:295-1962(+)